MIDNPLESLTNYSRLVSEVVHRPTVVRSTVAVWSDSPYTGIAEGEVFFSNGTRLRILVSTFPHHKHVPPDIKHNRIPAREISFTRPNLPVIIREIEKLTKA